MKHGTVGRRLVALGIALLAASLACTAPAGQQAGAPTPTSEEAAQVIPGLTPTSQAATQMPPAGATATTEPPPATVTTCLYNAVYVSDITIPDGTEVQVGNTFTKTWRIKNNGCQPWPDGTTLIFASGDQMSGPASAPVPPTALNGTQDVSINLKAPSPAGDYQGYWQLRTPDGIQFGDKVFVKIKSTSPASPTDTPEPPSGVDFTASYVGGVWSCSSGSSLTLYMYTAIVKNTGTVALKSGSYNLQSPPGTHVNNGNSNTPFQTIPTDPDCNASAMFGTKLDPGATAWVSGFKPTSPIAGGSQVRLVIKLCSEDDLAGDCKTVRVNFTTP